jgi:hypothetical protein
MMKNLYLQLDVVFYITKKMPNFNKIELFHSSIYYIMSEQPNRCPHCQHRLDVIETVFIENEEI